MNVDERKALLAALSRSHSAPQVGRRSVALPLLLLAAFMVGLALVEWGLWPMYRPAAIVLGVLIASAMPRVFAAIWRVR